MYGHWYADMVPKSYRVKIRMLGVYKYVRLILPFTLHSAWLPAGVQRGCLRATSALHKLPGFTSTDDGHVYTGHLQRHEMEDEPGRVHTLIRTHEVATAPNPGEAGADNLRHLLHGPVPDTDSPPAPEPVPETPETPQR